MSTNVLFNIPTDYVSRNAANKITKQLRVHDKGEVADGEVFRDAIEKAQQWRAQHALPAENCFRVLMGLVTAFPEAVISFRLKRMKSILAKIRRPGMNCQLGTMDDIGGCRLILTDMEQVRESVGILAERFELKEGNSIKDYIEKPRYSGYRSYHLITVNPGVDRDYRVEVQVRTQLQHLWSTTVEAMGFIYETDYKTEREAEGLSARERQIRTFFTIVSSLFSIEEGMPQVAGYEKTSDELIHDLHELELLESIIEDLSNVDDDVFLSENGTPFDQAGFYLMRFATEMQFLDIGYFSPDMLDEALLAYSNCEGNAFVASENQAIISFDDVVLAYARDGEQLGVAFPNYSARVGRFLEHIKPYL